MSILNQITATKRDEIAAAKTAISERELRAQINDAPPARDFFAAIAADAVAP